DRRAHAGIDDDGAGTIGGEGKFTYREHRRAGGVIQIENRDTLVVGHGIEGSLVVRDGDRAVGSGRLEAIGQAGQRVAEIGR
ncbi:UNVERIFIED_CONTAM: hypothetical protein QE602_11760, partial [Streptococcus suis]